MIPLLALSLFVGAAEANLFPTIPGPFSVATRVQDLTDTSRTDPYTPGSTAFRRILVSVFFPVDHAQQPCFLDMLPYLPPETLKFYTEYGATFGLPEDVPGSFEVEYCSLSRTAPCESSRKLTFPVAVFSPGHTVSRLLYTGIAQTLASRGYVVITVDHPWDADIVEFPDGTTIRSTNDTTIDPVIEMHLEASTMYRVLMKLDMLRDDRCDEEMFPSSLISYTTRR